MKYLLGVLICTLYLFVVKFNAEAQQIQPKSDNRDITSEFSTNRPNLDAEMLGNVYSYIQGQEFLLNRIKTELPDLKINAMYSDAEFKATYGNAIKNLDSELKKQWGVEFNNYISAVSNEVKLSLGEFKITNEFALQFFEAIKLRCEGQIESPIIETLLTLQFYEHPFYEFSKGFYRKYSTRDHLKSKGINLLINIPMSWIQKEGDRPNIVYKFVSNAGKGTEIGIVAIHNLEKECENLSQTEIENVFFSNEGIKQFLPSGCENISSEKITIDGLAGVQYTYKNTRKTTDFVIKSQSYNCMTIYNGIMISMNFSVNSINEFNEKRYSMYLPLFKLIATSLIVENKYQQSIVQP